jgi:hypothetical protein
MAAVSGKQGAAPTYLASLNEESAIEYATH